MSVQKKVAKDTYLFREGEAPDAMYIIKSGQFGITKTKGNSEVTLAELPAGAMVGEMAIFDRKPRSANVKALKDSEVIMLPYDSLTQQLENLPVWVKAIMRTMNENLREANKKIRILENPDSSQDRFPPHVVNKLISLINFVGFRYGTKEGEAILVPANRLRNYTIQVFQEATNKMDSMQEALQSLGLYKVEDLGEGKKKLTNLNPEFLFEFVDWYNEWLFKQDKDKVNVSEQEVNILNALIHFAKKTQPDAKGASKINLTTVQNESMKELGALIKVDDVNSLIEKKLISEKMTEESGLCVKLNLSEIEKPTRYWKLVWDLKSRLK